MTWGNPNAAWLFFVLLGGAFLWRYCIQREVRQRANFLSPLMQARLDTGVVVYKRLRFFLIGTAFFFLVFSLMQPRYGTVSVTTAHQTKSILLAIDVSYSMAAVDVSPSRFAVAQQQILSLIDALDGHYIGLIVFAGDAYLQCPMTTDYAALKGYIQELNPGFLPLQGTDLSAVLRVGSEVYSAVGMPFDMVIFSDGEALSGDTTSFLSQFKAQNIRVFTVGFGGDVGEPIPIVQEDKQVYKTDLSGQVVLSKQNRALLETVARETGGTYFSAEASDTGLSQLTNPQSETFLGATVRPKSWYGVPLVFAFLFFLAAWVLPETRTYRYQRLAHYRVNVKKYLKKIWPWLPMIGLILVQVPLHASPQNSWHYSRARAAYATGAYDKAAQHLGKIRTNKTGEYYYNLGNVAYQAGRFADAMTYYETAVSQIGTPKELAWVYYNMGNAAFQGNALEKAAHFYRKSLALDPHDADAKKNLELTLKKIKEQADTPPNEAPKPDTPQQQPQTPKALQPPPPYHQESQARQTLKTLQQKEQFTTMPSMNSHTQPDRDW